MLLVKDSSVLLQVRCHCTSGVGWCVCGRTLSQCHCCFSYSEVLVKTNLVEAKTDLISILKLKVFPEDII